MKNYHLEFFDNKTGKRYFYSDRMTKIDAIKDFIHTSTETFKESNATIIVLWETIGHRAGLFNEGFGTIFNCRPVAIKGISTQINKVSKIYFQSEVYLRLN